MPLLPTAPRERVAIGTAISAAGFILLKITLGLERSAGGVLYGLGAALVIRSLLQLRAEAARLRAHNG